MNTSRPSTDAAGSGRTQILSRFHPRLKKTHQGGAFVPVPRKTKATAVSASSPLPIKAAVSGPEPGRLVEDPAEASLPAEPVISSPLARLNRVRDRWLELRGRQLMLQLGSLVVIAGLLVIVLMAYHFGKSHGRSEAVQAPVSRGVSARSFPAESLEELDAALQSLRGGNSLDAFNDLKDLLKRLPAAPSLHYATAIAALQSGYPLEAARLADASIGLGERVSDAQALKAACSGSSDQENLLRAAIVADPMNPNPFLELATLLRSRGRTDEARVALKSAGLRLMPADSRVVLDTTLAIMSGTESAGDGVRAATGIPEHDFPAALAELQSGRFHQAAEILRRCRELLPPDLFAYLISDPEFRRYAARPELRGLF